MSSETITVSAEEDAARERRRSKSDNDKYELVSRSLASIREEIERGTEVDPELLHSIEAGLDNFYKDREQRG